MRLPATPVRRSSDWVLQLINIVFLLLMFFLVNGTIASQQDGQVEPPKSILIEAANPPSDAVFVTSGGAIRYFGDDVTIQQIGQRVENRNLPLRIVADRRLQAVRLLDVLSELRGRGFNNISLITTRDVVPP